MKTALAVKFCNFPIYARVALQERRASKRGSSSLQFLSNEMNNSSFCTHTRHVILPKDIAKKVPKRLMSEQEWRGLGVQQSQGWEHYMRWDPGKGDSQLYLKICRC